MGDLTENELGEALYKYLYGRRYLIVMDDMWSIEAWDKVKRLSYRIGGNWLEDCKILQRASIGQ
ncbi:hypothetical protein ACS0TY_034128 [Phlomoides rotata]